jgi:hypothetical protein
MTSGFLSHLDDLVERTDTIRTHLLELLDVLQNASESICDRENGRGNLGVDFQSVNLITTIHILMSNIATLSELITSVSQMVDAGPWASSICTDEFPKKCPERVVDLPMSPIGNWSGEIILKPSLQTFDPPSFAPQHSPDHMASIRQKRKQQGIQGGLVRALRAARQDNARIRRRYQDGIVFKQGSKSSLGLLLEEIRESNLDEMRLALQPDIPDQNERSCEGEGEEDQVETSAVTKPTVLDEICCNSAKIGAIIANRIRDCWIEGSDTGR